MDPRATPEDDLGCKINPLTIVMEKTITGHHISMRWRVMALITFMVVQITTVGQSILEQYTPLGRKQPILDRILFGQQWGSCIPYYDTLTLYQGQTFIWKTGVIEEIMTGKWSKDGDQLTLFILDVPDLIPDHHFVPFEVKFRIRKNFIVDHNNHRNKYKIVK